MRHNGARTTGLLAALLVMLAAIGCAARQPMQGGDAPDLDKKLSTFAWIEEGKLVTFIVGTRAARDREKMAYVPLEIAIGNRGLKTLTLTRESFTLVDEEGNRYPMATPQELFAGYEFFDIDRLMLAELEGIVFNRFAANQRYPSKFSPTHLARTGQSQLVFDVVHLPKHGYILDYIYFPQPATGLMNKRFELFIESPSLETPVFIKFRIE